MQVEANVTFRQQKMVTEEVAVVQVRIPYDPNKSLRETEEDLIAKAKKSDPNLKAIHLYAEVNGWRQKPDEEVDTSRVEAEKPDTNKGE